MWFAMTCIRFGGGRELNTVVEKHIIIILCVVCKELTSHCLVVVVCFNHGSVIIIEVPQSPETRPVVPTSPNWCYRPCIMWVHLYENRSCSVCKFLIIIDYTSSFSLLSSLPPTFHPPCSYTSEPDPWGKKENKSVGDRLGWKCTLHPECTLV